MNKNYVVNEVPRGLVELPRFADEWVVGRIAPQSVGFDVVNVSGDWLPWLPVHEVQKKGGLETMSCATFGTLTALEILSLFGSGRGIGKGGSSAEEPHGDCSTHLRGDGEVSPQRNRTDVASAVNFAERYTSTLAGTTTNGNSPHKVAETIRKYGVIDEEMLPFVDGMGWDDFYDMDEARSLIGRGRAWLRSWDVKHAWVDTDTESLRKALKTSPVGVAVYAWAQDGAVYVDMGRKANHWCLLVGGGGTEPWIVMDSYEPYIKKLDKNYRFGFAKCYSLKGVDRILGVWSFWQNVKIWLKMVF